MALTREAIYDDIVSTLLAERADVKLGMRGPSELSLDVLPLSGIRGAPNLDLAHRVRSGGPGRFSWMEPPPGVRPATASSAELRVLTASGASTLPVPIEIYELPEGRLLRAVFYTLTVSFGRDGEFEVCQWSLEPGGDDATLRADALDFLRGMSRGGELSVMQGDRIVTSVRLPPQDPDAELEATREFVTQVATLEEWSGQRIALPASVDELSAAKVAQTAAIVISRQVPLVLGDRLTALVSQTSERLDQVDELRLPRRFSETVLGVEVPLGECLLTVGVNVANTEATSGGFVRLDCELSDDQPRRVFEHLYPPPGRSRLLRRTLVAGSPIPPNPEELFKRVDFVRFEALGELLDAWDDEDGPLDPALAERVRRQWPD